MEAMMDKRQDARERILALERIRMVETELVQHSTALIRRLEQDLGQHLGTELPAPLLQLLNRGEQWWRPELSGYAIDDPRAFPIVFEVVQAIELESQSEWQPDPSRQQGVSYQDLVPPLRKLLDKRTQLAQIAGVN